MCLEKFDSLDADKNGVLSPDEIYPVILELSSEQPLNITMEHCLRFVGIFDAAGNGVLSRQEFTDFIKFVWFMRWLESQEEAAIVPEEAPVDDGITRIDQMLDMMHNDRQALKNQVGRLSCSPVVPDFIQKTFADEGFITMCLEKFDSLDVDQNGVLAPSEVFPVILELSLEQPLSVTYEHCATFVEMFDQDKNGVLSKGEFCDFVKFVWFMRWLESQEEQAVAPEPPADEGITRIDEMLDMMHNDCQELAKQVGRLSCSPIVPDFIQKTF